jgi:alkanesulfonate monooxygenase SsuD/methylene tetrahydromethanopterin reductase-like flavin-dependent oxidoreductase (luciferase family)
VNDAAARADRERDSVEAALYLTVTLDSDPKRAETIQRKYIEAYYGMPYELISSVQACHAGTVESAVDWIQSYVAEGARHIVLRSGVSSGGGHIERLAEVHDALRTMQ